MAEEQKSMERLSQSQHKSNGYSELEETVEQQRKGSNNIMSDSKDAQSLVQLTEKQRNDLIIQENYHELVFDSQKLDQEFLVMNQSVE